MISSLWFRCTTRFLVQVQRRLCLRYKVGRQICRRVGLLKSALLFGLCIFEIEIFLSFAEEGSETRTIYKSKRTELLVRSESYQCFGMFHVRRTCCLFSFLNRHP